MIDVTNQKVSQMMLEFELKGVKKFSKEWLGLLNSVEPQLLNSQRFEEAYVLRRDFTERFYHWFSGRNFNPVIGWHHATMAKLCNYLMFTQEALIHTQKALEILTKFYSGAEIIRDLQEILSGLKFIN